MAILSAPRYRFQPRRQPFNGRCMTVRRSFCYRSRKQVSIQDGDSARPPCGYPARPKACRGRFAGFWRWCPGAESNHRHCDFQSHALPTELPGPTCRRRSAPRAMGALAVALVAVQPVLIGRRTGDAIAFTEPFQQVAILAAAAAKGCVLGRRWLAAQRAGFRRVRHGRPTWRAKRRCAR